MNTLKGYRIFFALICLTLTLALTIGNVNASPTLQGQTDFAAIDAYVAAQVDDLGIPGLALGIVQDGQIVYLQGFGVADSSGRAVTPQTPFYIGSTTKSFTALAVMQLVEAGKIDLDAPVQKYLPWFELADKEASAKITVRNLLNHTTGISGKDGTPPLSSQQGLEERVRGLNTIQLTQPVGTTFQYSNVNYVIAGLIVEKVSGQSYADYVTNHIFEPLDMRHSYVSRAPALADGLSDSYYYMFGHAFELEGPKPPGEIPAGFLIASVEDMTHYVIAHLNDGRYGDTSILSSQGIAELHAPAMPERGIQYAMGWVVGTLDGMPIITHNGDDGRFHSSVFMMPDRNLGIVLLANASGLEQLAQVDGIARGILNILNGKPAEAASVDINMGIIHWAVVLTPLLQILGIVLVWRNRKSAGKWRVVLTVILNLAVVILLGFQLQMSGAISNLFLLTPDLGYSVIAVVVLGIGSVIYTAMNLMMRRSK